jgi:hypothetical protein
VTDLRCYVARADRVAARMIGDELMIMSGADSTLFTLNATAALLWQAADGVTPLREIVERSIVPRYEVDPDVACRDAVELVEDLARHGILQLSATPIPASGPPAPGAA